jgi:hypothetical protein
MALKPEGLHGERTGKQILGDVRELNEEATLRKSRMIRTEGSREVARKPKEQQ